MENRCSYTKINMIASGKRLKELIFCSGASVISLAKYLGISNQAVYKWINGESLPTTDNLYQLSKLLDAKMEDFIIADKTIEYKLPEIYVREDSI